MSLFKKADSRSWMSLNGDAVHVISIFLLALLFRLSLVWYLLGLDWWYNTGEGYEHTLLLKYLRSDQCYMPPGQYLFAGAINQWFGRPDFLALRLATILLSALMSVNIYRIGRDSFGRGAGLAAGYLSCISLTFAFHSVTFYPTIVAATIFSFFLVHFLRMLDRPREKEALITGLFLGLSILCRAEMLLFLPVSLLWFFLVKGIKREGVLSGSALLLGCSIIIACWACRNYAVSNRFVLVSRNAGVNFFIGNNPLQKGGYFHSHDYSTEKGDYLLAGVAYDLGHPGWFAHFFAQKFRLCWSRETWEHPFSLLENRFQKSPVKLFYDGFWHSRLSALLNDARYGSVYSGITVMYGFLIDMFWFFVLAGVVSCHVRWRKSYFLLLICFTTTAVLALFISGAQRWSVPVLPCFYLHMGSGIVFITRLYRMNRSEALVLLRSNLLLLVPVILAYGSWHVLITVNTAERSEIIGKLYPWNIFSTGRESLRLIIVESQLAYPLSRESFGKNRFSLRIGSHEIPHLEVAGPARSDEKYYFKRVQDLLFSNAVIINIPDALLGTMLEDIGLKNEGIRARDIIEALQGKIEVSYIPAWQFRRAVETGCNYLLKQLGPRSEPSYGKRL